MCEIQFRSSFSADVFTKEHMPSWPENNERANKFFKKSLDKRLSKDAWKISILREKYHFSKNYWQIFSEKLKCSESKPLRVSNTNVYQTLV